MINQLVSSYKYVYEWSLKIIGKWYRIGNVYIICTYSHGLVIVCVAVDDRQALRKSEIAQTSHDITDELWYRYDDLKVT